MYENDFTSAVDVTKEMVLRDIQIPFGQAPAL